MQIFVTSACPDKAQVKHPIKIDGLALSEGPTEVEKGLWLYTFDDPKVSTQIISSITVLYGGNKHWNYGGYPQTIEPDTNYTIIAYWYPPEDTGMLRPFYVFAPMPQWDGGSDF